MVETQNSEKRQKPDLKKMLFENRKRTYKMFASNLDDQPPEDEEIVRTKVQSKIDACYSGLGEVPGVLVDQVKRTKILTDLGFDKHSLARQVDFKVEPEEETKANGDVSYSTQKALNTISD